MEVNPNLNDGNSAEPHGGSAFARHGERIDDLMRDGLAILQRPGAFRFGTDSVLLSDFARPKPRDRVADLGAGTGILCLLMAANEPGATFDAVEVQQDIADMAQRSVRMNGLCQRIRVHALDMREAARALGYEGHHLVVCNPPYSPCGTAIENAVPGVRRARHMGDLTLEEIAKSGARLLKNGGRMALVFPAPRAFELMEALRRARLEPKRIRIVQDMPGAVPKLVLLDAVKGGGSMLDWLPPLILRSPDGNWSAEWRRIYHVPEEEEQ